jgi:hypothetical protein
MRKTHKKPDREGVNNLKNDSSYKFIGEVILKIDIV